ncbi:MAG: Holliday junction resolvase RuvX [Chitinophagales bacterium]|nr:Holliday junction resolvase RuvX [Bacteroidota bacterium]
MSRIVAIDYGGKRCGIAVTDALQIIAQGLCTVETKNLMSFLEEYVQKESVAQFVLGMPLKFDGSDGHITEAVRKFIKQLEQKFPTIPVQTINEQFTSKEAVRTLVIVGVPKMKRRNKALVDKMSACIILQDYMQQQSGDAFAMPTEIPPTLSRKRSSNHKKNYKRK